MSCQPRRMPRARGARGSRVQPEPPEPRRQAERSSGNGRVATHDDHSSCQPSESSSCHLGPPPEESVDLTLEHDAFQEKCKGEEEQYP